MQILFSQPMRPIIKVEHIGKQYLLGTREAAYSTIREVLTGAVRRPLKTLGRNGRQEQTIWALRDVSFEVYPGEVVGIIGRNGAGKSTLLRILSRVTEPTTGRAELYGRVGSLLEVGTGFHPELTGRENIFLNGSILGMTRKEIENKFDEIVFFSEVEKFIDTPVKRYSSGMYVRLAFAVAAHLEPEILVVDEVLAVGDLAFQQKCLSKMQDVSTQGRTVLFVSHNMGAISRLCVRTLLLEDGQIIKIGPSAEVVQSYVSRSVAGQSEYSQPHMSAKAMNLRRVAIETEAGDRRHEIGYHEPFLIVLEYEVNERVTNGAVGIGVFTLDGLCAFLSGDFDTDKEAMRTRTVGYYRAQVRIPGRWLNVGRYAVMIYISSERGETVYDRRETVTFEIADTGTPGSLHGISRQGVLQPLLEWKTIKQDS